MPNPVQPAAAVRPSSSESLDAVRDELLALDAGSLIAVNVDVAAAALVVIGAVPEIQKHRAALVDLCGEERTQVIDRLELVARAALQAHADFRMVATGVDVQPLSVQLVRVRDALLAEVRSLIARDVLPAHVAKEVVLGSGYKNQCVDVLQLVSAMRANWGVVEPETRITIDYLKNAEGLANELVTAVGMREQPTRSPAADIRDRAFTLLAKTYDAARRMISYLRWEQGDGDRIAPGFGNSRWGRRRKAPVVSEITPVTDAPDAVVPPGMPGASPFTTG